MAERLDATDFYDRLAPLFDVMTDWDSRLEVEGPFLRHWLEQVEARDVLDAACGSGGHALALAEWGYQVVGTDASPAMIALARAKAGKADKARVRENSSFRVVGLNDLPGPWPPFDVVLCLGNSLPHLLTEAALATALSNLAACLRPGGLLILHNLNYDRRWQMRPRWFGVNSGQFEGQQVLIWRFADYADYIEGAQPLVNFHIALFSQQENESWSVEVNSTLQRPLFQRDLAQLLPRAGLQDISYYGDMTGAPFNLEESPDLVVVARRAD